MENNNYKSEEDFLKHYDSTQFEKLSMTTDILLFSVSEEETENYRKLSKKYFSVLLVERNNYPFKDKFCLPGGFVKIDEDLDMAPGRILASEVNLHNIYLEQLCTFGKVHRDPRMRIISSAYMGLIDKNKLNDEVNPRASWFNITVIEKDNTIKLLLDNGEKIITIKAKRKKISKSSENYEYEIIENSDLAFDHAEVLLTGIYRLKNKIEYTDIVFNMMPEYFTLGELQQVYEAILGKELLDAAFRRIIASKVIKTEKMKTGEGHRPSALFKYIYKV